MIGTTLDPKWNQALRAVMLTEYLPGDERVPRTRKGRRIERPSCLCNSRDLVPSTEMCPRHELPLNKIQHPSFMSERRFGS